MVVREREVKGGEGREQALCCLQVLPGIAALLMMLAGKVAVMPADGKHSQPITVAISNHRGQGSSLGRHLSSFDELSVAVGRGAQQIRACGQRERESGRGTCWMSSGDVMTCSSSRGQHSHTLTHTLTCRPAEVI